MELRRAVGRYLEIAGDFGKPVALAAFGLPKDELTEMVAAWDEDYRLHRHFELIPWSGAAGEVAYSINGVAYAAILFRESIRDVFE